MINGKNNLLVSAVNPEQYNLSVEDNNYLYYSGVLRPVDSLIPYNSGITIQRITTTVGEVSPIYLVGMFPATIPNMSLTYKNMDYTINNPTFNISLGTILNSNNMS